MVVTSLVLRVRPMGAQDFSFSGTPLPEEKDPAKGASERSDPSNRLDFEAELTQLARNYAQKV